MIEKGTPENELCQCSSNWTQVPQEMTVGNFKIPNFSFLKSIGGMYATTGIVSTPKICGVKEKQTDRVRVVGIDRAILRGAHVCKYKFGMARPISAAADNIYVPICSFLLHGGKERREGRERKKTSKTHGGRHSVATALSEEKI